MTSPSLIRVGHRHIPHARGDAMHPRVRSARLWPRDAYDALLMDDTTLVDIRPIRDRLGEGEVHRSLGAVHVGLEDLVRRFDPRGWDRLPQATYAARLVILCQDGADSLGAADTLRRLGIPETRDVIGGFDAWRRSGLPISPWPEPDL